MSKNVDLVCKLHFPKENRLVCSSDTLFLDGLCLVQEKKVPDSEALESLLQQRNSLRFLLWEELSAILAPTGADPNYRYTEQFKLHGPVFAARSWDETAGKDGKKYENIISLLQPYFEDGCPLQFGVNSGEITSVIWKPDFG